MSRRLFCEISPLTYSISMFKCRNIRHIKNFFNIKSIARKKSKEKLPYLIYESNSLIRRKLGNVDMQLQENKAINLKIATPKVSGILIRPKETFSFWSLVGSCSKYKGYKEGLTIGKGSAGKGVGGGMCQFTNLIHWLVMHTPLTITEHHHHNGIDMFPDFNRQIPFGVGTSIMYNYLDYRFTNNTNITFQLITYVTDEYLCGEILADKPLDIKYHIDVEDEYFSYENNNYYRHNKIYRNLVDKNTGNTISKELIMENKAKVMYDSEFIDKEKIRSI
jgi:vancomycin resistance protein VanW